jgi:site-specific recombinase XerD
MNEYIKEVCQLAQIDTPTIITKFVGKQRIDQTFPKYELVSSHAARRTFAIISLEQGMRIEILQGILGHSNIRTTMKYVFILDEIRNQEMQKTWNNFDLKK